MINFLVLNLILDGKDISSLLKNDILKIPLYYLRAFRSSLVRNISMVYSGDIISKVFAIGTALLLIRGLAINQYAAYTAFYGILTLIPGLVGGGINLALIRFSAEHISKTGKKAYELYFINLIFQVTLYAVSFAVLLLFADKINTLLFGQKAFGSALRYGLIAGFGLLLSQAGRSTYQAEERFGTYIKTLWLRRIPAFFIIIFLFLLNQLNFQRAAQTICMIELCVGVGITIHIFWNFRLRHVTAIFSEHLGFIKNFFSSTAWLIAYFFTLSAFQRLDIFMLSHFSTEAELANYGVAFRYYSLALLLLGSIHAVLLPRFSKVDMQDSVRQREFSLKWLKTTGWLIIPIVSAVALGKPLFIWISGLQYERAFYILVVFSIGVALSLMFSPLVNVLISRKAFKFLFILAVGALVLNFSGNYLLIPLWGGIGAAVVTILSHNFLIQGLILIKVLRSA